MKTPASVRLWCVRLPFLARRGLSLCLLTAALAFALGCGGGKSEGVKNEVSGKVTHNDKPVAGTLVFVYADGKEVSSPLLPDGGYMVPDAPPGQVKIYIKPVAGFAVPPMKGGAEMPKDGPVSAGPGVPPPRQYQTVAGGLTYEVKAGKQTHDIPLK
jgi:hypothetical protein